MFLICKFMTDLYGVENGLIFIGKRETYIKKKDYTKKYDNPMKTKTP